MFKFQQRHIIIGTRLFTIRNVRIEIAFQNNPRAILIIDVDKYHRKAYKSAISGIVHLKTSK